MLMSQKQKAGIVNLTIPNISRRLPTLYDLIPPCYDDRESLVLTSSPFRILPSRDM